MRKIYIEYMDLNDLENWPGNPKDHDLGLIHEMINKFGFVSPVMIDEDSGKMIAGHGRIETLLQKKASGEDPPGRIIKEKDKWLVPVIRGLRFEDTDSAFAYLIGENQSTIMGGWHEELLIKELSRLANEAVNELSGTGFDGEDLDRMIRATDRIETNFTLTIGKFSYVFKNNPAQVELTKQFSEKADKAWKEDTAQSIYKFALNILENWREHGKAD